VEGNEKTFTLSNTVAITRGDKEVKTGALSKNLENAKRGVAADITTEGTGDAEKVTKIALKAGKRKKTDN
jgi:hypothetical protein